jgi:hypothetical protein
MSQGPPAVSVLQRSVDAPGNQPQVLDKGAGCEDRVRVRAELQVRPRRAPPPCASSAWEGGSPSRLGAEHVGPRCCGQFHP